jgi:cysteine desulfurase
MTAPIYFDYAAATPMDERVLAVMRPFHTEQFYNPSATYLAAKSVAHSLGMARAKVASVLGVRPAEVVFTAGGTEANNLAIKGIMDCYPDANVVVSAIEHESVLAPAQQYDCRIAPVDAQGVVDLVALEKLIDEKTALVSVMYANNEIGTIQPLKEVARIIARKRAQRGSKDALPLYFHTDACQAANYLDLHTSRMGVDLLTLNGGKIYGPKQSGALFVSGQVALQPQILGGGQERNLRSGTENVAQNVGLAKALNVVQQIRHEETERLQELQKYFFDEVQKHLPAVVINGSRKKRLPNNLHVTLPGVDNERLLMQLDEEGILAAAGSACSASDEEPSHVLRAMGISEADARSSLRFTLGRGTTREHLDRLLDALSRHCS